jgi:hypothetical protein
MRPVDASIMISPPDSAEQQEEVGRWKGMLIFVVILRVHIIFNEAFRH